MNIIVNIALLKEQLKRFWGLSALLFIWYVATIALPVSMLGQYRDYLAFATLISLTISVLFAPLVAVIVLFRFQNQAKSAAVMNSYPLTRNQLHATNALAGMVLLILPLLAICTFMVFHDLFSYPIFIAYPESSQFSDSTFVIIWLFSFTALSFLFYLSLYIIAAMLSGNSIITLLLCATLHLLPIALRSLVLVICEYFVLGFYSRINIFDFLAYLHPTIFILLGLHEGYMLSIGLWCSIIIAALVICCVVAANKRAHELTDDSVVFPYVKNVLVFILSVSGSLLTGYIFFIIFLSAFAMYVGFAIGFFIAYCIAQMIAEKTFNIMKKIRDSIKFGAIAVGLLLLIIITTSSDIFGYERFVPHLADIKGVTMLDVQTFFDNRDKLTNTDLNELLVKDIEIINEIINLHQAIVNERGTLKRYGFERRPFSASARYINILYMLNNGNVVVRRYLLPIDFMNDNDIHGLRLKNRFSTSLLQNRPDLIDSITLRGLRNSYEPLLENTHQRSEILTISELVHIQTFLDALMKDSELITQSRSSAVGIQAEIFFEPAEGLNSPHRRMESLLFRIEDNRQGNVRDWLNEIDISN